MIKQQSEVIKQKEKKAKRAKKCAHRIGGELTILNTILFYFPFNIHLMILLENQNYLIRKLVCVNFDAKDIVHKTDTCRFRTAKNAFFSKCLILKTKAGRSNKLLEGRFRFLS